MSITKDSDRQYTLVARAEFTYEDTPMSTAVAAIDIPAGAVVTGGYIAWTTAWDDDGDDTYTLDVGDGVDDDRYTPTAADIDGTAALLALVPTGYQYPAPDTIDVKLVPATGDDTLSQGAAVLVVEYIIVGRGNENYR